MVGRDENAREFAPDEMDSALAAFDRRTFLKLMGASIAAAGAGGLGACSRPQPQEHTVPYVRSPEYVVPGLPAYYASALPTNGYASGFGRGVIVESHEGRPTKIEGNPRHPSSLGGSDIFMQAAALQLYDPDRSPFPLHGGRASNWGGFLNQMSAFIQARGGPSNIRVAMLSRTITSPSLAAQLQQMHALFPKFSWYVDDLPGQANARDGQRRAFGRAVTLQCDFTRARRVLSLDAPFLSGGAEEPAGLRYAREFSHSHRLPWHAFGPNELLYTAGATTETARDMSRLYMVESTFTATGARADHRLAVAPSMIPHIAAALAGAIFGVAPIAVTLPAAVTTWVAAAAADLQANPRNAVVLAGEYLPPQVHALVHAVNAALQAPVHYLDPVDAIPPGDSSLAALTRRLAGGDVDLLLLMDVNPVFTAPPDLEVPGVLARFAQHPDHRAVHLGAYIDETAVLCGQHIPLSHALEAWGDLRAHDGTATIVQPLIEPLWSSKSMGEFLAGFLAMGAEMSGEESNTSSADHFASGYGLVRRYWMDQWKTLAPEERERRWRNSLREGVIEGTTSRPVDMPAPDGPRLLAELLSTLRPTSGLELTFRLDPTLGDGESGWANHPWLQELPKPLTRVTWDNVAILAPATAAALGIDARPPESRGTVPVIRVWDGAHSIEIPAWIQSGHPENAITLHVGSGHALGGAIQKNAGTNVYPLRTSAQPWQRSGSGIHVEKTARRVAIACTQFTQSMGDRSVARSRPIGTLHLPEAPPATSRITGDAPDATPKTVHLSLYDQVPYAGYKWGMVIDLAACIGCNACVIACQAENNIPSVGKEQVFRGREMHWIRIDTYHDPVNQRVQFQPMLCQHCENAPCEVVCPVEATTHSNEGINEMTYNRCVGTRYCSNNCPYKVRRFNFLDFNHDASTGLPANIAALPAMQKNPNVTVRSRGVMEKCTYCIQRINRARINAKRDWAKSGHPLEVTALPPMREPADDPALSGGKARDLPRLQIQTACQQACPAEAIIFGDLNDRASVVAQLKSHSPWKELNYGVLSELNTQPRTSYLERLLNPNIAMRTREGGGT